MMPKLKALASICNKTECNENCLKNQPVINFCSKK